MLNTFVSQDNKDPVVCAMPLAVYVRDQLLRARNDYGGPTMSLEQALKELAQRGEVEGEVEEEEHLSIFQLEARRERVELVESTIPLAVVDPKGKHPRLPPSLKRKERRLRPPLRVRQRRRSSWLLLCLLSGRLRYISNNILGSNGRCRFACFD